MTRKLLLSKKFWCFFLVTFVIAACMMCVELNNRADDKRATEQLLIARRDELNRQVNALIEQLEYVRSDRGIEQLARANGMIMPGETQFVAVENK